MPEKTVQHFHISAWTIFQFFGILLLLAVIYLTRDILTALVFAVIIASAIEPAIEWLKDKRIPRILSVILIYLAFVTALALGVYLVIPLIIEELNNFSFVYPEVQGQVEKEFERLGFTSLPGLGDNIESLLRVPGQYLEKLGGGVVNVASAVFGGLFSFLLITVFSFYLATQEKGIQSFLRLITPLSYEPYIIDLWERSQRKLGRWLRAQMLLGAIVGVLIFFGLTFLGVKHALLFAVLAAIFEIIPVVGPILAAVPAVVTAFLSSSFLGVSTIVLYVVVQQLESHVIVPVVMRKSVGLSPLVVVLALLIGAKIGGIFGILLSVPLTAIIAEFVNDWDKKKRALIPE